MWSRLPLGYAVRLAGERRFDKEGGIHHGVYVVYHFGQYAFGSAA